MERNVAFSGDRTPIICIIGAGFSGLTAGIQLKRKLNLTSFTIYDENHDIGGTWLRNTYPGVGCDIPSHLYSWSFELNPDWPDVYSSSADIWAYMQKVTNKYELYPHIQFNTAVKATVWDELTKKWKVSMTNKDTGKEETKEFDIVITGVGMLRAPNIPKEFQAFKGTMLHSAEWDHTLDLSNKVVGVVGSGSSALQVITAIAPIVKELHCYQRRPAHVLERPGNKYSTTWRFVFKFFPPLMWIIRFLFFVKFELFHLTFFDGSKVFNYADKKTREFLENEVENPELRKKLTPFATYGCRRVLFHNDYYRSLKLSHVTVHPDRIQEINGNVISSADGVKTTLDVLILATGFKASDYLDPLKVVGKNSLNINGGWKNNKPSAYLGIMTNSAPNLFLLLGPNTLLGHNSVLFMMECQVNHIIQLIEEMISKNAKAIQPKLDVEEKYMQEIEISLRKMVWATGMCASWYNDRNGNVTALWPKNCVSYWRRTRKVDFNNYETS